MGSPVVLMEAMAAGVCVISGDLPAIRELVRHGKPAYWLHRAMSQGLRRRFGRCWIIANCDANWARVAGIGCTANSQRDRT